MNPRMKNPALVIPEAMKAIQALMGASRGGVSPVTLELVHLRASQINRCEACTDSGRKAALKNHESEVRLDALSHWRTSDLFSEDEMAALDLAECVTRLADQEDAVPDAVWEKFCASFDEPARASLILWIATTNLFNRLNVSTRQVPMNW